MLVSLFYIKHCVINLFEKNMWKSYICRHFPSMTFGFSDTSPKCMCRQLHTSLPAGRGAAGKGKKCDSYYMGYLLSGSCFWCDILFWASTLPGMSDPDHLSYSFSGNMCKFPPQGRVSSACFPSPDHVITLHTISASPFMFILPGALHP